MAEIRKGSDLIRTMGETEGRLKKVERQMAVQRKGASSVVAEEQTLSAGATVLATADAVTLITTSNCLVSFYVQVTLKTSTGSAYVYLSDDAQSTTLQVIRTADPVFETRGMRPGTVDGEGFDPGQLAPVYPMVFVMTTAGKHKWKLVYSVDGGGTATFKDRKLFAWVTPF